MNMLIYCENGNLTIRKPNGLEWTHDRVDKPNLGFDFEVLIYDDIEVKIPKWEDGKQFDDQDKIQLNDEEVDAIEQYIDNSVAPEGCTMGNQYSNQIATQAQDQINQQVDSYGFPDLMNVVAAAREGSNHPLRSDARRVLEYYDVMWNVYVGVMDEIRSTREDLLLPLDEYQSRFPQPQQSLIE
jgi:hypothetical protein